MPTDAPILVAGTADAPLEYPVPNAQEIQLKVCAANFDGTNAAGDFIPAVVIVSDGGVVIAHAADPANVVTAGNSAEVSWFPGVKNGGGSSSSAGAAYAQGLYEGAPPFSFTGPDAQPSPFHLVDTTDSSIMSWSTVTNTNDTLTLNAPGTYMLYAGIQHSGGSADVGGMIYSTQDFGSGHRYFSTILATPALATTPFTPNSEDFAVINTTGGTAINLMIEQPAAAFVALFDSSLAAVYLATGTI